MERWIRRYWRRSLVIAYDLVAVIVAALVAAGVRLAPADFDAVFSLGIGLAFIAVPVCGLAFWLGGVHRSLWRFASIGDLILIVRAVTASAVILGIIGIVSGKSGLHETLSPYLIAVFAVFLAFLMGVGRLAIRVAKERRWMTGAPGKHVVLVGAGTFGRALLYQIRAGKNGNLHVQALADDDPALHGATVEGVRVAGTLDDMPELLTRYQPDEVLIAIPTLPRKRFRQVYDACESAGVPCRTLPSVEELMDGRVEYSRLRPVMVEDLLGREPVQLDLLAIAQTLRGKRVLVTGGGGSIGSELVRQVLGHAPQSLVVIDNSEFNLYQIEMEIAARHTAGITAVECVLADVCDARCMRDLLARHRPQVVFHAAAYKHVPIVEQNVIAGVRNNVFGTRSVADAAVEAGVERFVLISTDKAVNPASVMGASKRIAEQYCQVLNGAHPTHFITVRFGNVMESTGSVIPRFRAQIDQGGPVTVTHPEVMRFFMTVHEAVGLILQAAVIGKGGEIFVLDMGRPVAIRELAERMIRLSGLEPDHDIEIRFTGLRPGEKLNEDLFHSSENLRPTTHERLLLADQQRPEAHVLSDLLAQLDTALRLGNVEAVRDRVQALVPEYFPLTRNLGRPARGLRVVEGGAA